MLTLGTYVKEGVEICIAYTNVLRPRGGNTCGRVINSGAGACVALPLESSSLRRWWTGRRTSYDELSETVRCATAGFRGCNVPDGSSGAEIEEGVSAMYRYSICNKNNGFDATMTTRNESL